jgi:hypothetical protein
MNEIGNHQPPVLKLLGHQHSATLFLFFCPFTSILGRYSIAS